MHCPWDSILTLYWTPAPSPFLVSGHSFLYWYYSFRNPSWPISSALRQPMLLTISRSKSQGYRSLPRVTHLLSCPTDSHQGMLLLGAPQSPRWPLHISLLNQAAFALCPPDKSLRCSFLLPFPLFLLSLPHPLSHTQTKKKHTHTYTHHHTHTSKRRAGTVYFHLFQVPAQFESISD